MSFTLDKLYSLLPAIYRIQDLESNGESGALLGNITQSNSSPQSLRSLLTIFQEQIAVLEENLDQLYDDQFIETCAEWVIPYIGDLVGFQVSHDIGSRSLREEVAYTISYRRRKGTAALVEQLTRDATGWGTHVVEYFKSLATTQHMNRLRPDNRLVNIAHDDFTLLSSPFETQVHNASIRHATSEHGAYSGTTIGIFLWRLSAYALSNVPATRLDDYRYLLNPLGCNTQLFSRSPATSLVETLTGPQSIAMPLTRYLLETFLDDYYGQNKSLLLMQDGKKVLPGAHQQLSDLFVISDLGDLVDDDEIFVDWANMPKDKIAIDPVRGRIAFPKDRPAPHDVQSTFYYGFSADIGGGEYRRVDSFTLLTPVVSFSSRTTPALATLQDALDSVLQQGDGVVEITDSGRYQQSLSMHVVANRRIELRAADSCRPSLHLEQEAYETDDEDESDEKEDRTKKVDKKESDKVDRGEKRKHRDDKDDKDDLEIPELVIEGEDGSQVTINGLVFSSGRLRIRGTPAQVTLKHCTLVPGIALLEDGTPQNPGEASIIVESESVTLVIDSCIVGALQVAEGANVRISNSIIDANHEASFAYSAIEAIGSNSSDDREDIDDSALGGPLYIENSTVIGMVRTCLLSMASNTLFLGASPDDEDEAEWGTWGTEPIYVQRLQEGGMRYSYIPSGVRAPRRYKCQPAQDTQNMDRLQLTSFQYGDAGYGQLSNRCPVSVTQGADDGAEMGAFHLLYQPQREANLNVRLSEYMRFDVTPELFFMT